MNTAGAGNVQQLTPLHLSKRWEGKFDDLVVYSDDQAERIREIISILIFGQILKVLIVKEQRSLHFYHYMLGKPFSRLEPIGPRRQVIANLLQDAKLRVTLTSVIALRESRLSSSEMLAYHRAVQALANSPELIRKTPEDLLLGQKLVEICQRAGETIREDLDRISALDQPLRYEYLQKLDNSGLNGCLASTYGSEPPNLGTAHLGRTTFPHVTLGGLEET